MTRLLLRCSQVLIKQLIAWTLYGRLHDPHLEFFIRSNHQPDTPENDVSGKYQDPRGTIGEKPRWHTQFYLEKPFLPTLIPEGTGKDILFIGKAVRTIRESKQKTVDFGPDFASKHLQSLATVSDALVHRPLEFASVIARIKKDVASTLWDVVVMNEHLMSHLTAFRNFYLLGNGSFWVDFIEECDELRSRAAARLALVTEHDLNRAFKRVLRKTSPQDVDLAVDRLQFKIEKTEPAVSSLSETLIGLPIRLEYHVEWPLDLIFTRNDIDK
ncbi:Gamma-tubulin complex component 4 [Borealophlyctis nickersoniae]|nr:Gamma-tubulin complex component 4 [Borealophlyctis nickersoniae]